MGHILEKKYPDFKFGFKTDRFGVKFWVAFRKGGGFFYAHLPSNHLLAFKNAGTQGEISSFQNPPELLRINHPHLRKINFLQNFEIPVMADNETGIGSDGAVHEFVVIFVF